MKPENAADFSQQVAAWTAEATSGAISWIEFAERVLAAQLSSEGGVMADRDRQRRCRFPEVIFGQSKTAEQIETAARRLLLDAEEILVTRVGADIAAEVAAGFGHHFYHPRARTLRLATRPIQNERNFTFSPENKAAPELAKGPWVPVVGVLAAGTTDIAIAEEAAQTLAWMGFQSFQVIDCGVAGPFRLLAKLDWIRRADVIVVVAGMEGALASVAGGLVSVPVIAVPTSIGYGANLQGITTMLSMLSSCAAGVTTVNIDGGFKGGYVAGLMCQRMKERGS